MGYNERMARAMQFEQWVIEYLRSRPAIAAVTEAGAGVRSNAFQRELTRLTSPQARLHRYHPDGQYIIKDQVVYFDSKTGLTLERDAYLSYLYYRKVFRSHVVLFVWYDDWVYWQYINQIAFEDSAAIVAQFPPEQQLPVDEDNWIHPRHAKRDHIKKDMSGTPYAYLQKDCLRPLCKCTENELQSMAIPIQVPVNL